MTDLTFSDRLRLAAYAARDFRRSALAALYQLPLVRSRHGPAVADRFVIVPPDLRTADASFASEIDVGHFGLAGAVIELKGRSPFAVDQPSRAWGRELHGFGWLRHLTAAGDDKARRLAQSLAADWMRRHPLPEGLAFEAGVTARRILSWVAHAGLLLDGASPRAYEATLDSLARQIQLLANTAETAPAGRPLLISRIALATAALCISGHEKRIEPATTEMLDELDRQILPDGGHVSRNPAVLLECLLDLLPLRQCYVARDRELPPRLLTTLTRGMRMLRYLRHGDGTLARFNGMGATRADLLGTVLAYDDVAATPLQDVPNSRYLQLARGRTLVLMDAGAPPPLELAGDAHAGCLSFEMSSGAQSIIVNCGVPGPAHQDWRAASRATASHSTLMLAGTSSSRLIPHARLQRRIGAEPIQGPGHVEAWRTDTPDGLVGRASHDGYLARFGLIHTRVLTLAHDGARLDGLDRLAPPKGILRLKEDLAFAIAFHLLPGVGAEREVMEDTAACARIAPPRGEPWVLTARGAEIAIEESMHFADFSGPRRALKVVLRGRTAGDTAVQWQLRRRA